MDYIYITASTDKWKQTYYQKFRKHDHGQQTTFLKQVYAQGLADAKAVDPKTTLDKIRFSKLNQQSGQPASGVEIKSQVLFMSDNKENLNSSEIPPKVTFENLLNYLWTTALGTGENSQPKDVLSKAATAIYLCYPGIPINPKSLDNMLDASNPGGDPAPLEYFSRWIDRVPDITRIYWQPLLGKASDAYRMILSSANASKIVSTFTPEEKANYEAAKKILWTTKPSLFPGKPPTVVASDDYQNYLNARTNYLTAVRSYNTNWSTYDFGKLEDRRKWLAVAGGLQMDIDNTWNAWVANYKEDIENALAIMGSSLRNGIGEEITRASQILSGSAVTSSLPGGGTYYPAYTFPYGWWREDSTGWMQATIKSDMSYTHLEDHRKSFSASASFLGLFSFGGSGGYSEHRESEETVSSNISVSIEYAVIDVQRSWLNTEWMKSSAWYVKGERAGKVSSGTIAGNTNDMMMPVVPTRFIAARKIVMSGDWSRDTRERIEKNITAGTSFGFGPFSIGGKYEQHDTSETHTSQFNGNELKVNGIQIIGFMGAAPPKAASLADPSLPSHSLNSSQPLRTTAGRGFSTLARSGLFRKNSSQGIPVKVKNISSQERRFSSITLFSTRNRFPASVASSAIKSTLMLARKL
jgi:hypothetical protein